MKNVIVLAMLMAFVLVSCNPKKENVEATAPATETTPSTLPTVETTESYACSMHPEITGKKDAKCSKCGMKLTEPVTK